MSAISSTRGTARRSPTLGLVTAFALVVACRGLTSEEVRAKLSPKFVEAFTEHEDLLDWALSEQTNFPTPQGGESGGGMVLSVSPFVTLFEDFLTPRECEFLKVYAQRRLQPAMVVLSGDDWFGKQQETRSNEQHWTEPVEEKTVPLLRHMLKRMHRIARSPDETVEAVQIGRYNVSKKYEGHLDTDPASGVGRPATLIIYLADVESGGDTLFPVGRYDCGATWHDDPKTNEKVYGAQMCCNSPELDKNETVRVHPKMGRAVLFHNHRPDGTIDQKAHHIGCPVNEGVKWIAQRWFRFEPYNKVSYHDAEGWDPRFDGERESQAETRHFRVISHSSPKLYLEENFMSEEEASYLSNWKSSISEVVLSDQDILSSPTLSELTQRARDLARLPPTVETVLRLKRIEKGSEEPPKMDSPPEERAAQLATVRAFLRVAEEGGQLSFLADTRARASCAGADTQDCCESGSVTRVRALERDAVLWYSYGQDATLDPASTHLTCPVLEGEIRIIEWAFVLDQAPVVNGPSTPGEAQQPKIEFMNHEPETFKIYWVPPQGGDEAFMQDLPMGPYTKVNLDTYRGHVFHVRDQAGALVETAKVTGKSMQRVDVIRKSDTRDEL